MRGHGSRDGGQYAPKYSVVPEGRAAWKEHLPSLSLAYATAADAWDEGFRQISVIDESPRRTVFHPFEEAGDYSVRLAGMMVWDDHLPSLAMAQRSAAEPRAMGLQDVQIVDDATGELVE